jgi:hypothetical protein
MITKPKNQSKDSELIGIFTKHLGWHLARITFFVKFIKALCKLQTVNFVKLAQGFEGTAKPESNLRRVQRFFAEFTIDRDVIAHLIFGLLPEGGPYRLCMDRTNWKFGRINIIILMISVCMEGVSIPLLWTMLEKQGNSSCQEREELLNRYVSLFGRKSIGSMLADREFIGDKWFEELIHQGVRFYIRLRGNMWVKSPGKGNIKAFWLFNSLSLNEPYYHRELVCIKNQWLYLSGMKVMNREGRLEYVIIASYSFDYQALLKYKDRWQVETLFKAMKTSGFNIEGTHLTDINRIAKLLCLISVAFVWAYRVGIYKHKNIKPIKIKKHGRKEISIFKYGLLFIAHALLNPLNINLYKLCVKILSCT